MLPNDVGHGRECLPQAGHPVVDEDDLLVVARGAVAEQDGAEPRDVDGRRLGLPAAGQR